MMKPMIGLMMGLMMGLMIGLMIGLMMGLMMGPMMRLVLSTSVRRSSPMSFIVRVCLVVAA